MGAPGMYALLGPAELVFLSLLTRRGAMDRWAR
jgi:hypothetical protein